MIFNKNYILILKKEKKKIFYNFIFSGNGNDNGYDNGNGYGYGNGYSINMDL